ncbi:MAG: hypothetical protein ACKV0T_06305 [Planctomycetales bacterium]
MPVDVSFPELTERLRQHVDRLAGLIGPRHLGKPVALQAAATYIEPMLCLEIVGYYATGAGSQQAPPGIPRGLRWLLPRRGDFLAAVGNPRSWRLAWGFRQSFKRATRLPLFSILLPESISEIRLSDNSSYWDQNYSVLTARDADPNGEGDQVQAGWGTLPIS